MPGDISSSISSGIEPHVLSYPGRCDNQLFITGRGGQKKGEWDSMVQSSYHSTILSSNHPTILQAPENRPRPRHRKAGRRLCAHINICRPAAAAEKVEKISRSGIDNPDGHMV